MKQGEGLRQEPQSSTIPSPRFTRNHDTWNLLHHHEGTDSLTFLMEAPRYDFSELLFGKFQDPDDSQCRRVNFKTKCV